SAQVDGADSENIGGAVGPGLGRAECDWTIDRERVGATVVHENAEPGGTIDGVAGQRERGGAANGDVLSNSSCHPNPADGGRGRTEGRLIGKCGVEFRVIGGTWHGIRGPVLLCAPNGVV